MVSDTKIECPNCKSIVRKDGFSKHKKSKKCIKATNSKKVEVVEKKEIKPKVVEKVVVVEPKLEEKIEMDSIVKTGDDKYQITLNLTNTHIIDFFKKNKETTGTTETTDLELQLYNVIFNSNNYKLRKALTHNALNEEPLLTEKIEMNSIINTDKKQFEYLLTYKLNVIEMGFIIYNLDVIIQDYLKQEIHNNTELEALCKLHKLLNTEQNTILKKMKEED